MADGCFGSTGASLGEFSHLITRRVITMDLKRNIKCRNIVFTINRLQTGLKSQRELECFAEFKTAVQCCQNSRYEGQGKSTFLIAFSPDRSKIATSQGDHTIKVFDVRTGRLLSSLVGHSRSAWSLCYHPYLNNIIASGSLSGEIRVWDLSTGDYQSFEVAIGHVISSLSFYTCDNILAVAATYKLYLLNWKTGHIVHSLATGSVQESVRIVKFGMVTDWMLTGILNDPDKKQLFGDVGIQRNAELGMHAMQTISCHRLEDQSASSAATVDQREAPSAYTLTETRETNSAAIDLSEPAKKIENEEQRRGESGDELRSLDLGECNESKQDRTVKLNSAKRVRKDISEHVPDDGANRTLDRGPEENDSASRTLDRGPEENDSASRTLNRGPEENDCSSRTLNRGPEENDGASRTLDRGPEESDGASRTLDRGPEESDGASRTLDRGPEESDGARITSPRLEERSNERPFRSTMWNVNLDQQEIVASHSNLAVAITDGNSTSDISMVNSSLPVYSFISYPSATGYNSSVSDVPARGHAVATATARTPRHVHTAVVIAGSIPDESEAALRTAINRAIAGAFAGNGEGAVASNIVNTTYRLQLWSLRDNRIADLSRSRENVVVPFCKLHNDGSIDISQDETLLAAYVPSVNGFPENGNVCVFSLHTENLGQCIFRKSYGPNSVCLSFSPLNNYLLVGLASRRVVHSPGSDELIGQILRLPENGCESVTDDQVVLTMLHPEKVASRSSVSVNTAKFHPTPGVGIIYGTNLGIVRHCRIGAKLAKEKF